MDESRFKKLRGFLDEQIKRFGDEAKKHKGQYQRFRFWVIALTAATTILAGSGAIFNQIWDRVLDLFVLVTSALAAAIVSYEGVRKPVELWMSERNIFHALNDLKRELEFLGEERASESEIDDIFHRMQDILRLAQDKWRGGGNGASQKNASPSGTPFSDTRRTP